MSYIFKTVLHGERVIRGKKHPGKSVSPVRLQHREYGIMSFLARACARKETGLFLARVRAREKLKIKIISFCNTLVINILHSDI